MTSEHVLKCGPIFTVSAESREFFFGEIVQRRRRMDYSLVQNLSEFFWLFINDEKFPFADHILYSHD